LRAIDSQVGTEARKALEWLDRITTWTESRAAGRVELQGPEDQYQTWAEVEKYLLPDTPLSYEDEDPEEEDLARALNERLAFRNSTNRTSHESPTCHVTPSPLLNTITPSTNLGTHPPVKVKIDAICATSPKLNKLAQEAPSSTCATPRQGSPSSGIPASVRPLLNFVVWRAHNDVEPGTARYILLTDDSVIQKQAQKFGVRAKLLNQVRNIVAKDGRKLDVGKPLPEEDTLENGVIQDDIPAMDEDDDAEEILFKPLHRAVPTITPNGFSNVLDPNHFGRTPATTRRGNGSNHTSTPTPPRPAGGRVTPNASRTRGNNVPVARQARQLQFVKPIDPDSYARPAPVLRRGRGGSRRLWEPT